MAVACCIKGCRYEAGAFVVDIDVSSDDGVSVVTSANLDLTQSAAQINSAIQAIARQVVIDGGGAAVNANSVRVLGSAA